MFKVLDLFAGAGGFSLGFKMGGLDVTTHLEIDEYASSTIKNNFPTSTVVTDDIRFVDVSKFDKIEVLNEFPFERMTPCLCVKGLEYFKNTAQLMLINKIIDRINTSLFTTRNIIVLEIVPKPIKRSAKGRK